jgi:phosphoribosyl 1,2-cyclic phosphate phosphodiesterase
MKILFLGTSATWPLPRPGKCSCKICQSRDSRDKRLRSALLIKFKKSNILIDCGPDIVKELRREKIKKINAVVISHAHSDHISGLKRADFKKLHTRGAVPVYAGLNAHRIIKKNFSQKFDYQKKIINLYKEFKVDKIKVLPLLVKHYKGITTFAFKVASGKKFFVYMPDYKKIYPKSERYIKNCHLLILGGSILSKKIPWHNPIVRGIELAQKLKTKKVYFTHIGHDTLPHKKLEKFVQTQGGQNFHVAYDGLEIKL